MTSNCHTEVTNEREVESMSMICGKCRENRDTPKVKDKDRKIISSLYMAFWFKRVNSWFLAVHNVTRVRVILLTTTPDVSYKSQISTTSDL